MKEYRIEITDLAESDLESIGDYIAYTLGNPTAAANTVRGIRQKVNSLMWFPERNELDDDEILAELGIRTDHFRNYKIFYLIEKESVYIVRIFHVKVDSQSKLYKTFRI